LENITKVNKNINNVSLTKNFIKDKIWSDKEVNNQDIHLDNDKNNILTHRYNKTPRYLFYKLMEKYEMDYLDNLEMSIGDIDKYLDIKEHMALREYEQLKTNFNLPSNIITEIRDDLILKPTNDMINKSRFIKFKKYSNMIM